MHRQEALLAMLDGCIVMADENIPFHRHIEHGGFFPFRWDSYGGGEASSYGNGHVAGFRCGRWERSNNTFWVWCNKFRRATDDDIKRIWTDVAKWRREDEESKKPFVAIAEGI